MQIKDFIKKYDPQNQVEVLINSHKQIEFAWNNDFNFNAKDFGDINNIIISGLGGSAISGDLLKNFLKDELNIPVIVNRNYDLPAFVSEKSLVIASSYSGNTEETISVLNQAMSKKVKVICITTGGKIAQIASENKTPVVYLQKGFQPRYALGLSFFSLLRIFQILGLVSNQDNIVNSAIKLWKNKAVEYSSEENEAVDIAKNLIGFIPVIYSVSDFTNTAGFRFKCQLNENSKMHAFHHEYPEMNHNEIVGWESFIEKSFYSKVVNITDKSYHKQIQKRFSIVSKLIQNSGVEIITLESSQNEFKLRLLDLIYLIDWVSYYAGVLRGFDPSEIDNIITLKEKLG